MQIRAMNLKLIQAIVKYITTLVVAMILMTWGTTNLVTNGMDLIFGAPGRDWGFSIFMLILFSLVPFAIGLWLAIRILRSPTDTS